MAPPRPSPESPWTRPLPHVRASRAIKEEAISPRKLSEVIGVSRVTIYRWIKRGYIKAYRIGPSIIRIPRTEVTRMRQHRIPYIQSNTCPQHSVVR